PKLLNSTANIVTNIVMMFFLLYFLLVEGRSMEKYISRMIPLQKHNVSALSSETKTMIKANALGIPIISLIQGVTSAIGYWIFGVEDWGMWGFVTGVFAFFPIVGTTIIWLPLVIFLYSKGLTWPATGLLIYSLLITGNVDYLARLSLMKRMGDVHPLVTILGVIVGLGLFGFIGLIFGPLLISYFLVLVKIYMNEFSESTDTEAANDA
ncbi:MAG TPA: AI-2E family transporter, partial [Ferruginibacter sp.]|nr:AI-2E family transporter [Ferruginibacter sp.]